MIQTCHSTKKNKQKHTHTFLSVETLCGFNNSLPPVLESFNFCPILSQLQTPVPLPCFCPILSELQANNANDHTCMSVLLKPRCKRRNTPAVEFLSYSVRTRGTGPQCCSSAVCCLDWKTPQTRTFEFLSYSVRTRGGRIDLRISVICPKWCRITLLSTF